MQSEEVDILLVEDTASDAEMTIRALKKGKWPHRIVHLWDGKEAYDFLSGTGDYTERDVQQKPRVILMDLKMPRLDGIDLLKLIRGNALTKKIPVVVLTSSKEDQDLEQCYECGVNSYIVKPVDFKDYNAMISDLESYWMTHNQIPVRL